MSFQPTVLKLYFQKNKSMTCLKSSLFTIRYLSFTVVGLLAFFLTACNHNPSSNKRFQSLHSSHTNITFQNTIIESEDFNILNFHYIYNGGGVGVGDFNKDGLPDLVFSGNQVSSELYLNQGDLSFENISAAANFQTTGWITGVSIIDLNGDGWDDIYLSVGGLDCDGNCNNQLFIHQGLNENGIPTFVEKAAEYGLDDGLYTQQAVFFDHDLDGDLDVYLLHNVIDKRDKNAPSKKNFINKKSIDKLLINNGLNQFTDASEQFNINQRGYGLGVALNDFNQDGYPDIYVANDFLSDDIIYVSQSNENGTITHYDNLSKTYLKHQSYNSMGVDIADVNNDALADICVLDMLPETHERLKNMQGFMNYDKFQMTLRADYAPQFIRNVLQMNNGYLLGDQLPFSEVGYFAEIYNTDWSWSPLLADFDNDGDRDLYVTNGYGKDITDLDFINYSSQAGGFGTKEQRNRELFEKVQEMQSVEISNYFFENNGSHAYYKDRKANGAPNDFPQFTNRSNDWIDSKNSISNGAVYADLDNDGDLEIIVNNINQPAYILENQTIQQNENQANYLKINLLAQQKTTTAIGTKIYLWADNEMQYYYHSPVRGYLSSMDQTVHFGLNSTQQVDSITIVWANQEVLKMRNITANQTITIDNNIALDTVFHTQDLYPNLQVDATIFQELDLADLTHLYQESPYQDFDAQPLLLHQHSRQGPCLATANVDGQPGDELFVGGAKGFPSKIYSQKSDGSYRVQTLPDSLSEDTAATFFDFDQDGDVDLYVVSGSTEFKPNDPALRDRLYVNDGTGNFTLSTNHQSSDKHSGGCIAAADFDQDGDVDLFVGGRVTPRHYPNAPRSFLLVNHHGKFIDHTNKLAYPLDNIGMITDALWSDYDGDGWQDLVVVGEWMPITIFKNKKGSFNQKDVIEIENSTGLWNCIATADFDQDGDPDYMLGNLGINARLQASPAEPMALYTADFDKNGSPDPLIAQFYTTKNGDRQQYPIHARDDVVRQVTKIKASYVTYADYGRANFTDILHKAADNTAIIEAKHLTTSLLKNKGNGDFELQVLPLAAQIAPIQDILIEDFNGDGDLDALLTGNDYTAEKNGGWYDAFNGLLLMGNGGTSFEPYSTAESGFYVSGDGRSLVQLVDQNGKRKIVAGQNSGMLKIFEY